MIRKVKCDKCSKPFAAEIDPEPDREVKPEILCSRCYALSLSRPTSQCPDATSQHPSQHLGTEK